MSTDTATRRPPFGPDVHGNTRAGQDTRATAALRHANDAIARAYYDGADRYAPEAMATARAEWERGREYRDLIRDAACLDGIEDATPTTYADLACEAAGRAADLAADALRD